MKLVLVEWYDAHGDKGWETVKDLTEKLGMFPCYTCGVLLAATKGHHLVALSVSDPMDLESELVAVEWIAIPDVNIKKTTVLGTIPQKVRMAKKAKKKK